MKSRLIDLFYRADVWLCINLPVVFGMRLWWHMLWIRRVSNHISRTMDPWIFMWLSSNQKQDAYRNLLQARQAFAFIRLGLRGGIFILQKV